ncbi:MAG: cell division protein FtsB [Gammaproteobacteria bacterium]|nr:cell division protein FtsB [Gammaproteobacteria bacterium]
MRILVAILLILLLALQYDLWVGDGSLATVWHLQKEVDAQQLENTYLTERNETLAAEVKDLKTGLDAIEERARNDLGMVKEGETYIQVVEEPVENGN